MSSPFDAHPWAPPVALAAFTLLLWYRTAGFPLYYWDDSVYLFDDPRLSALTFANLRAIFTRPFFANYHPVTTLTFLWDRLVWKTWLPGFHLTHLFFYTGGVVLAYFFFLSIVRNKFWALAGAALFSCHALHVEDVAWLAARKDVVCLFFSAASLTLYVHYARARDRRSGPQKLWFAYMAMLLVFSLALGAKGYSAALPVIFVAWDVCFSKRFRWQLVFDKLPPLTLALGLTVVTFLAQDETSALVKDPTLVYQLNAFDRVALLLKIFALYVGRSLLPIHLSATYLVSNKGWMPGWVALLGLLLFGALVYGFFAIRRTLPALAMGLALFVLPLFTTLNTFFTLRIWMADRYALFSTLGSTLVLAAAGVWLSERACPSSQKVFLAVTASMLLLNSGLAYNRAETWSSASLIHSDAIRKNFPVLSGKGVLTAEEIREKTEGRQVPSTLPEMLERLSIALQHEGNKEQSERLTELLGDLGYSGLGIGIAELRRGNLDRAIDAFTIEIARGEWYAAKAAKLLGDAYRRKGQPEKALQAYEQSASLYRKQRQSPRDALLAEGDLEFGLKNLSKALEVFQLMAREGPGDPIGPFCIARTMEAMGKNSEAYKQYERVAAMPAASFKDRYLTLADVQKQMGVLAQKMNDYPAAMRHYEQYLSLNPDDPQRADIEQTLKKLKEVSR